MVDRARLGSPHPTPYNVNSLIRYHKEVSPKKIYIVVNYSLSVIRESSGKILKFHGAFFYVLEFVCGLQFYDNQPFCFSASMIALPINNRYDGVNIMIIILLTFIMTCFLEHYVLYRDICREWKYFNWREQSVFLTVCNKIIKSRVIHSFQRQRCLWRWCLYVIKYLKLIRKRIYKNIYNLHNILLLYYIYPWFAFFFLVKW